MEAKQRDTVYGYVRSNYDGENMVSDIIQIIFKYYLIILDSVILTDSNDLDTFYNLLTPKLNSLNSNYCIEIVEMEIVQNHFINIVMVISIH